MSDGMEQGVQILNRDPGQKETGRITFRFIHYDDQKNNNGCGDYICHLSWVYDNYI